MLKIRKAEIRDESDSFHHSSSTRSCESLFPLLRVAAERTRMKRRARSSPGSDVDDDTPVYGARSHFSLTLNSCSGLAPELYKPGDRVEAPRVGSCTDYLSARVSGGGEKRGRISYSVTFDDGTARSGVEQSTLLPLGSLGAAYPEGLHPTAKVMDTRTGHVGTMTCIAKNHRLWVRGADKVLVSYTPADAAAGTLVPVAVGGAAATVGGAAGKAAATAAIPQAQGGGRAKVGAAKRRASSPPSKALTPTPGPRRTEHSGAVALQVASQNKSAKIEIEEGAALSFGTLNNHTATTGTGCVDKAVKSAACPAPSSSAEACPVVPSRPPSKAGRPSPSPLAAKGTLKGNTGSPEQQQQQQQALPELTFAVFHSPDCALHKGVQVPEKPQRMDFCLNVCRLEVSATFMFL
jgi:hypothetical protein